MRNDRLPSDVGRKREVVHVLTVDAAPRQKW
jgi:hypothetical protein